MARARADKADLDKRTFLDGAIYLYRRKNSKQGKWDIRLKVLGHKGYIIRSSGTANEHEAYNLAHELYLDCLAKQRAGRRLDSKRIRGGMVVIPAGLLAERLAEKGNDPSKGNMFAEDPQARKIIETLAMNAVMDAERALGNSPLDVSAQKVGYDIQSLDPKAGHLRFIEVKGRIDGADSRSRLRLGIRCSGQIGLVLLEQLKIAGLDDLVNRIHCPLGLGMHRMDRVLHFHLEHMVSQLDGIAQHREIVMGVIMVALRIVMAFLTLNSNRT
ncbi:DUF3883 domain-containing protein [Novosphingobium aerophilum]|uniref:DUF3883 domain-containing protein n=1 Tax=Novosphingobium aerophilum TaxID=2839843 RepID=UPI001F20656B|nr:DUF3883 domain-containing protein [Novosphingobium aerophilum]